MTTSVVDSGSSLHGRMRARRSNERRASRRRLERSHPDQVVGRRREQKLPVDTGTSAMTELAQPTEIGQLGFVAFSLLEQPALGIGRRLMRLIRAPLPVEIDRRITRIVGRLAGLVSPFEALLTRRGLQQSAIDREMLGRQQAAA